MIKTIKHEELYCDVCGKRVDRFEKVGDSTPVTYKIEKKIFYGGTQMISDICEPCTNEISLLLLKLQGAKGDAT